MSALQPLPPVEYEINSEFKLCLLCDQVDQEDQVDQVDAVLEWRGRRENPAVADIPHAAAGQPDPGQGVEREEEQAKHGVGEPVAALLHQAVELPVGLHHVGPGPKEEGRKSIGWGEYFRAPLNHSEAPPHICNPAGAGGHAGGSGAEAEITNPLA